jgi:hypothetical protein
MAQSIGACDKKSLIPKDWQSLSATNQEFPHEPPGHHKTADG